MAPPDELWWVDPPLREQLQRDPVGVLKGLGVNVPADAPAHVVRDVFRIASLLWVDGQIVPRNRFHIDPFDEGLLFGRGVWESTRTVGGVPWLWPAHLDRLKRTAALLDIAVAPDRLPDGRQVTDYVRGLTAADVVVRLNVSAGRPGKEGMVWMSAAVRSAPLPSVRLHTLRNPVLTDQPYLTGKTFHYASRMRTGQQAWKAGFDSALLVDADDHLLEASHANVFVRLPDGWATPPAGAGLLLPGTVRQHLLDHAPVPMREQPIPKALLAEAREVFLTNSNVGVVPVTRIDDQTYPVGPETEDLLRWLQTELTPG